MYQCAKIHSIWRILGFVTNFDQKHVRRGSLRQAEPHNNLVLEKNL